MVNAHVPDSIIAATAMFTGITLLTRNTRDFRKISNLGIRKILRAIHLVLSCIADNSRKTSR